jgi:hypothetical protein
MPSLLLRASNSLRVAVTVVIWLPPAARGHGSMEASPAGKRMCCLCRHDEDRVDAAPPAPGAASRGLHEGGTAVADVPGLLAGKAI